MSFGTCILWWEISYSYLWSSICHVLIFFASFHFFVFIFGLYQFYYGGSRHGFHCIYSGFNELLSVIWLLSIISVKYQPIYLQIFTSSLFLSRFSIFGTLTADVSKLDIFSTGHWRAVQFSSIFFSLLFRFNDFN